MHFLRPLIPMILVMVALFAVKNALNYVLIATLIATALYLLVLITVPQVRNRP